MKIAILTNFQDFNPGYSLSGIVEDQIVLLHRYGHDVHLFLSAKGNTVSIDSVQDRHPKVTIHAVVPFSHLIDYSTIQDLSVSGEDETTNHDLLINKTEELLTKELLGFDIVFTHDWVFVGWFLPYGLACIRASHNLPNVRFFHWIHSIPSGMRDWWEIRKYGTNHKLIFPNSTDAIRVVEQYRGGLENVRVIPHCKDFRSWFDFSKDTCNIIDRIPELMQADIIQILPAGTDRLSAKGLNHVIKIFGHLKKLGLKVCLIVANQWASGRVRSECLDPYELLAVSSGLIPKTEFLFTSDLGGKFKNGLEKRTLRELFILSNLFIFPTREESFGLVVPEASLSSSCLLVLNKSLGMQIEITGGNALYFDFGSFDRQHNIENEESYFKDIASIIIARLKQSESINTRTFFRQENNYDILYKKYYLPIMMENSLI